MDNAIPASAQNPVFQAETRIVEIAIVASDSKGEPVVDLTAGDFRVFDNGPFPAAKKMAVQKGSV